MNYYSRIRITDRERSNMCNVLNIEDIEDISDNENIGTNDIGSNNIGDRYFDQDIEINDKLDNENLGEIFGD